MNEALAKERRLCKVRLIYFLRKLYEHSCNGAGRCRTVRNDGHWHRPFSEPEKPKKTSVLVVQSLNSGRVRRTAGTGQAHAFPQFRRSFICLRLRFRLLRRKWVVKRTLFEKRGPSVNDGLLPPIRFTKIKKNYLTLDKNFIF